MVILGNKHSIFIVQKKKKNDDKFLQIGNNDSYPRTKQQNNGWS